MPEVVKVMFLALCLLQFKRCGWLWILMKMETKLFQKVIKIEPLGAHGRVVFEIVRGVERMYFLMIFLLRNKSTQSRNYQRLWQRN